MMLEQYRMTVSPPECLPSEIRVTATVEFEDDLTELLPYLNAELGPCMYDRDVPFLRLNRLGKLIVFYPKRIGIAGLRDEDEAQEVFEEIRKTINSVSLRKERINPSHWSLSDVKPLDIFKLLPRTNCGECGKSTCMAFAAALAIGEAGMDDCPPLSDKASAAQRSQLLTLFGRRQQSGGSGDGGPRG